MLIILDCCFAANAARDTTDGTTKEILAACGRENPTLGVGIRSFTSALIEELKAFGDTPFTVSMLHTRLITMRWRLAFTPIYALLSEHGGNSIQLAPLPEAEATVTPSKSSPCSPRPPEPTETRVLLAVSVVESTVPDIAQWVNWLTNQAPWDVINVQVRVESVFNSHSTLVLVSVPTHAWNRLPDKAAYQFIGFIRSDNLLPRPWQSLDLSMKMLQQDTRMQDPPWNGLNEYPLSEVVDAPFMPLTRCDDSGYGGSGDIVSEWDQVYTVNDYVQGKLTEKDLYRDVYSENDWRHNSKGSQSVLPLLQTTPPPSKHASLDSDGAYSRKRRHSIFSQTAFY